MNIVNKTNQNTEPIPLPFRDGHMEIDNSFLEILQCCTRATEYALLRRRTSIASKPGADFGSACHEAMTLRYSQGTDLTKAEQQELELRQVKALETFFQSHPMPEEGFRNLNWAVELFVTRYNTRYPIEPFNLLAVDDKPLIELGFRLPFAVLNSANILQPYTEESLAESGRVIDYTGRIDLAILWDGYPFVMDHKTSSIMGESFWDALRVSTQQIGYCWAFWKSTGVVPKGFVVNAIGTRPPPMKPKKGIEAWWEDNYQRNKEYLMPGQLEEWEENTFLLMEELIWHWNRQKFPMKKQWCVGKFSKCQFYEVCNGLPRGQRLELLASQLFQDNTWSPLNPR